MRVLAILLPAALAGCQAVEFPQDRPPPPPSVAVLGRQLSFGAGVRSFEDEDFGKLDEPAVWTLDYCEPIGYGPLRMEGGLHYSYDDAHETAGGQDVHLKGQTFDMSAGLNLSWLVGRLRPYVGVGGAILWLRMRGIDDATDAVFDDEEVTLGGYAKAGLLFQVTPSSHVGVEFRHFAGGSVTLDDSELDSDSDQVVFVLGTSYE